MVNTTLGCVKTIFNCEQTMARPACVNFYKCNIYLIGYLNAAFIHNLIFADAPEPWQYGFQDPATPVMEGIVDLHHDICFFLIVVLVFVLWMLSRTLFYFHQSRNPIPEKIIHGTTIEIAWTITPSIILVLIAIPSFALLYSLDEMVDPAITIKAIGHQWYWSYEYSDYTTSDSQNIAFDSYMLPEEDLEAGQLRLLEVDQRVVVPVNTHIRMILTAADVLHSWAVPSLGLKVDCVPGRLNQVSMFIRREGVFYGQCSELCLRLDRYVDSKEALNLFVSLIACPSVLYDVILHELGLKQVSVIISHELYNLMSKIKAFEFINAGRLLWSSNLFEAALTSDRDKDGFPPRLIPRTGINFNIKNMIRHTVILSNRIKRIIFRGTGLKNTIINSVSISKLGNPVRINRNRDLLNLPLSLCETRRYRLLNRGILSKKLYNMVAGGKIGTKQPSEARFPNFLAYRGGRNSLAFKPHLVTICRSYSSMICNKSDYLNKELTNDILLEIKQGNWITINQKVKLIEYIETCQKNLSALGIKKEYRKIYYIMELLVNSLLFQVYAIEILSSNRGSATPGIDNRVLRNNVDDKIRLLTDLKGFRNRKPSPLKRIYIPKKDGEKLPLSIPSITDRAIQQLFLLILDPIVEANSDSYSFGFRKGRNPIMAIGSLQKKLQNKVRGDSKTLEPTYIWDAYIRKFFYSTHHEWLLKNTPFPPKYKYILEGWLKSGFIEFGSEKILETNETQGGIISPLFMNVCLNGLESLIEESMYEYKEQVPYASIRKRYIDGLRLSIKDVDKSRAAAARRKDGKFKEHSIDCKLFRFADDIRVISGSHILLDIIKSKFQNFLKERGLEIHPDKSRTIKLGVNTTFDFLGYTFVFLMRTQSIRSKLVHRSTPEYRLKGRPILYVHPSRSQLKAIKLRIKQLLRSKQNSSAYNIISELNPIIRGWVNYYSYSNSIGILNSFRAWLYRRIVIWLRKKHPKVSMGWINRQYLLTENIVEQHDLNRSVINYIAKHKSIEQIISCKFNFYGIAKRSAEGELYKIPKLNILLWPDRIKKLVTATVFTPNRNLLAGSFYLNREDWLKEAIKFQTLHGNKENQLFNKLWKRDNGICFICKQSLAEELTDFKGDIEIHHIVPFAEGGSHKLDNLVLTHRNCHLSLPKNGERGPTQKVINQKLSI